MSTIEGGIISTNDDEIYNTLLQLRSHGWDRDLSLEKQQELRKEWEVSDFSALYTFYIPGFNLRSTDLQAQIGVKQLDKVESFSYQDITAPYKMYQDQGLCKFIQEMFNVSMDEIIECSNYVKQFYDDARIEYLNKPFLIISIYINNV
jgi:dTDP-4-amino-4,6-dideoxygalactose transaminase